MKKSRMYEETKTWNPFKGCRFDCNYCKPSFQKLAKRQKKHCELCYKYEPHEHSDRITKIPQAKIVFVCGNGDITFARPKFVKLLIEEIKKQNEYNPDITYYFQSKNPECLDQYLGEFPENVIVVTTLETNRDKDYEKVSKAPKPSIRFKAFKALNWPRKVITIEPVMDFDEAIFLKWIILIKPEYVWIGYNSRPREVSLPEPDLSKLRHFIDVLRQKGIKVKVKESRGLIE